MSNEATPANSRERAEREFSFASPQDRDNFFMLYDLMEDKRVNTGAPYKDQFYSTVSQKLQEPHTDAPYKSGFIGGNVHTADKVVKYYIHVSRDNKIICRIQQEETAK